MKTKVNWLRKRIYKYRTARFRKDIARLLDRMELVEIDGQEYYIFPN